MLPQDLDSVDVFPDRRLRNDYCVHSALLWFRSPVRCLSANNQQRNHDEFSSRPHEGWPGLAALAAAASSHAAIAYDQNVTPESSSVWATPTAPSRSTVPAAWNWGCAASFATDPPVSPPTSSTATATALTVLPPASRRRRRSRPASGASNGRSTPTRAGPAASKLGALTYLLGIDNDPSLGTSFFHLRPIHAINPGNPGFGTVWWDHAMGNNATTAATKQVATDANDYASQIAALNVAQQSWKASWYMPGYDPTVDGTYNFYLAAFDAAGAPGRPHRHPDHRRPGRHGGARNRGRWRWPAWPCSVSSRAPPPGLIPPSPGAAGRRLPPRSRRPVFTPGRRMKPPSHFIAATSGVGAVGVRGGARRTRTSCVPLSSTSGTALPACTTPSTLTSATSACSTVNWYRASRKR